MDGQGDGKAGQSVELAVMSTGVLREDLKAQIQKVNARFYSGGAGYPWDDVNHRVDPTYGVNLMAWYDNNWQLLASNNASAASPNLVDWSTIDPATIDKLFYGGGKKYTFAIVPVKPNGFGDPACVDPATNHCDMGQVSTEYMEVTLTYQLP